MQILFVTECEFLGNAHRFGLAVSVTGLLPELIGEGK